MPAARGQRRSVALVVMPVHIARHPSLAAATLAEELRRRGHHVDVHYLNVEATRKIGVSTYCTIGREASWVHKVSEWLFSHPSITPGAADLAAMQTFLRERRVDSLSGLDLGHLRQTFDELLDEWAGSRPWAQYDVVGFAVMFQQLNASLRLARAIRDRFPAVRIVLGGSGLEEPMGGAVFSRYPFLDAVFSGYAERSFPEWVESMPARADKPISDDGVENLDDLPIPSFDEYVQALDAHGLRHKVDPKILIESSRGCWYGQKQHCTFCGINGVQMRYRHKSADRVFEEIRVLSRYGLPLWSADNIMPLDYFDTLFPRLERERVPFNGFYEIKSNASRSELQTLARVGIRHLQPGIESFSTPVLRRMKKGVTGIQNVWFLRASRELGIDCQWNVLWGFPGEEPQEYEKMARLFPRLSHLQAPASSGKILLLRHSPNHTNAAGLGFAGVKPFPSYEMAFGPHPHLDEQAYLFEHDYADGRDPASYTRKMDEEAERWIAADRKQIRPVCQVVPLLGRRWILDTRKVSRVGLGMPRLVPLDEDEWALLGAIESPTPKSQLQREWDRATPLGPLLHRFIHEGWAFEGDGRVVRLVIIRNDPSVVAEARRVVRKKVKGARRLVQKYAGG